ncbi:MAG TPA: hypothetical protein VFP65_16365 [Anaeromyxobacteraceae bacterium]|nr:hypothetical protein [Anaeromyxobacteraceae bacterium]
MDELRLLLDEEGLSRRACPRCGGHFGVRWTRREARLLAGALARRIDHLNAAEADDGPPRHCPYCGLTASPQGWWLPDQLRWIDAQAGELRAEVRWRRMKAPLDRLAARPLPTYLPLAPGSREPPELAHAPPDLEVVPLPCCGEEIRVSPGWLGPVRCHLCGFIHARAAVRDIGLELALLRDWMQTT